MSAMISALGNLSAPWEQPSAQKLFSPRAAKVEEPRPYFVGRARAKDQLNMALATQDETAQLRRLEQALEVPSVRYDEVLTPRVMKAAKQLNNLTRTMDSEERKKQQETGVQKQRTMGLTEQTPEDEQDATQEGFVEEEAAAATRIQSLYRGKKEREETKKMVEEETKAATKIQSRYRGKAVRKK